MKQLYLLPLLVVLAGCTGQFSNPFAPKAAPKPAETTAPTQRPSGGTVIGGAGKTAESLDTTTPEERAAAVTPAATGGPLGTTVASLGDPGQGGFWLKTPLVKAETQGKVETVTGQTVNVTLIPLGGGASGGSEISLAAMRQLGLGLTALPTLTVSGG